MRLTKRNKQTESSDLERSSTPAQLDKLAPELAAAPGEKPPVQRAVYSTYHRWVKISRLSIGAFIIMAGFAIVWLIPWMPSGLDTKDYSPEAGFTVYLLLLVAALGILSLYVQERTRRNRESLMMWSTVYDETTGLHNRMYLFDRLSLECERARRNGDLFSVIVLQMRGGSSSNKRDQTAALSNHALRKIAELIDGMTHPTDMVALLSNHELVVLANRVDRDGRRRLQERLGEAVAGQLPDLQPGFGVDVRTGAATYGVDGSEPSGLVQAARTSAAMGIHNRPKAA